MLLVKKYYHTLYHPLTGSSIESSYFFAIGLYYARDVKFVAILYIFFLGLAVNGLITWREELRLKAKSAGRS